MIKEIYLVRGTDQESYPEFKDRIFNITTVLLKKINPEALKFTITEMAPPRITIIPFRRTKIAAISIYKSSTKTIEELREAEGFYGAYRVTEALPVAYRKNWKDGEPTPGACLLTLFSKKKSIDYKTFIHRWHNGHTPLSLRIHPLWNYVRNVVNESLFVDSARFDGIVEEQVRDAADLLNPFRFFGNPLIIIPRMIMVYSDTKSFIDYAGMETYLAAEYHIKSSYISRES
jgi:hypothetical protein